MKYLIKIAVLGSILAALAAMTGGCAHSPDFDLRAGIAPSPQDIQRGQLEAYLLQAAIPKYDDDLLTGYVDSVLQRILAPLPENQIPFRVTILDSAEVNARACSNGHIFVDRNMLAYLNSESELAGLLAHEVAHVVLRHAAEEQKKREQMKVLALRMESAGATRQIRDVAETFGKAMTQGYSRRMEIEADRFAASLLPKAGYNPLGVLKLLEMIEHMSELDLQFIQRMGMNPLRYTGVFSTHPHAPTRIQAIQRDLGQHLIRHGIAKADRNRYIQAIAGLVYGPHVADGLIRSGQYLNGAYGVSFEIPAHWAYVLIPDNGLAAWPDQSSDTSIQFFVLKEKSQDDLPSEPARSSENSLRLIDYGKPEDVLINGFKMRFVDAKKAEDRLPVRLAIVFGSRARFIFQLINATSDARAVFKRTVESFHELSDQNIRALQDSRIVIAKTGPEGTFEPLSQSPGSLITDDSTVMQLNGFYEPGTGPNTGDLIKWIR